MIKLKYKVENWGWFAKIPRGGVIRSHIGSTQGCGVVLMLERFSHLFGLGSSIELANLSLVLSLRVSMLRERATW